MRAMLSGKIRTFLFCNCLTVIILAFSSNSIAHSGRLNAEGCHINRTSGESHCHRSNTSQRSTPSSGIEKYSRDHFGRGWADFDGDCQNSRVEALISQSTGPVRFKDPNQCSISAGRWISLFTGKVIQDPTKIDIDHLVPLKWAWDHGANHWPSNKRNKFANDPINLLSVEASLNRQKGSKGPDEWLPPTGHCEYISRFIRVVRLYGLSLPNKYPKIHSDLCSNARE